MIIKHKDVVLKTLAFSEEMTGLVSEIKYARSSEELKHLLPHIKKRGIIFHLDYAESTDDENYGIVYSGIVIDKVGDSLEEILSSEEDNIYAITSLEEYLDYELDGTDISIKITDFMSAKASKDESHNITAISFSMHISLERKPTLWSTNATV